MLFTDLLTPPSCNRNCKFFVQFTGNSINCPSQTSDFQSQFLCLLQSFKKIQTVMDIIFIDTRFSICHRLWDTVNHHPGTSFEKPEVRRRSLVALEDAVASAGRCVHWRISNRRQGRLSSQKRVTRLPSTERSSLQ